MRKITNYTRNTAAKCVSARITRGGHLYSKNFGLAEYKSWRAAEKAAVAWIAGIKPKLPPAIQPKNRMTQRNSSGVVGVQLKRSVKKGRWESYAWQAIWPDKPGGIRFGITKHGDTQAFALAAIARRLETVDRKVIEKEYARFKGSPQYRALLKRKALSVA